MNSVCRHLRSLSNLLKLKFMQLKSTRCVKIDYHINTAVFLLKMGKWVNVKSCNVVLLLETGEF